MKKDNEFDFEIIKHVATISDDESKWSTELNLVKFGDNEPKLDIRRWNEDHTRMSKGISLNETEYNNLVKFILSKTKKSKK